MKRGAILLVISVVLILLVSSVVSAGLFDWLKKTITGKATEGTLDMNISLGNTPPNITFVTPIDSISLSNDNPVTVNFNFTVHDPNGVDNIDTTTATGNLSKSGEDSRTNTTCAYVGANGDGYTGNFTCNVVLWYWDGDGTWTVGTSIQDKSGATYHNITQTATVEVLDGILLNNADLGWSSVSAGGINTTADTAVIINNTGNQDYTLKVNATDLYGETNTDEAIWAGNFSVGDSTGGSPPAQCGNATATEMYESEFTVVDSAALNAGNHSVNDGGTGQEQLYHCINIVGSELSSQSYSTWNEGSWTYSTV